MMKIDESKNNIVKVSFKGKEQKIALLSDLHWDNPKCDRKKLKKHLDYCKKNDIPIHINGDMFCLMQGRGDRRSNKSDIRPEHNNARYLDSVWQTAVEWFKPYANLIFCIGYGNHETAIIKWQETDVLRNFVNALNTEAGTNIQLGGYGGWCIYTLETTKTMRVSFNHKYFHGSGGGGIVTKGAINLTRALETYENYDLFSMGHIHENWARNDYRDTLVSSGKNQKLIQRHIHSAITGTYKEEYGTGAKGWHVERGAPIKHIGGRIAKLTTIEKSREMVKQVSSDLFPLL